MISSRYHDLVRSSIDGRSALRTTWVLLTLLAGACSGGPNDTHERDPVVNDAGAADGRASEQGPATATGGSASRDGQVSGSTPDKAGPDATAGADSSGQDSGSSGDAGTASITGSGGDGGGAIVAPTLDQTGNPIYAQLDTYKSWLSKAATDDAKLSVDRQLADNIVTWQLPHGGFYKNGVDKYHARWDGSEARADWKGDNGVELGTIDNQATVSELMFLADVYQRSRADSYRDAVHKAFAFLLTMQLPSGGFPQVYPARTGTSYSNYVTFNDDAMARVLILLEHAVREQPPLHGELLTSEQRAHAKSAIARAVDYILSAQIVQAGAKTVWCAQHDPTTHEPRGARSYELPSKSGSESVGVVGFLMTQPQTEAVKAAVKAALAWYASPAVRRENTAYVKRPDGNTDDGYNPIQVRQGSTMWCRFYELVSDDCFFSGRTSTDNPPGKGKQRDIMAIEPERRYGYQWGGGYGAKLLEYARRVDY